MNWTKTKPTIADVNEWFYVRMGDGTIFFKEVTFMHDMLYLAGECNSGLQKVSYGNMLSMYNDNTEFCGPIPLPPDWKKIRQKSYPDKIMYPERLR